MWAVGPVFSFRCVTHLYLLISMQQVDRTAMLNRIVEGEVCDATAAGLCSSAGYLINPCKNKPGRHSKDNGGFHIKSCNFTRFFLNKKNVGEP
jgi:hypothetical protein